MTALLLVVMAASAGASDGASQEALWTTRGDFENNAATIVYHPTARNMVKVSGLGQSDDASVSLVNFGRNTIAAGYSHTVGLKSDGSVVALGSNWYGETEVSSWSGVVAVSAGWYNTLGLKSDGTVVASGSLNTGVSSWSDIVAIDVGSNHAVGVRSDGTVVAAGGAGEAKANVSAWSDIKAVAAVGLHTLGLRSDGTVVRAGGVHSDWNGVPAWSGITAIAGGQNHAVGLKSDGTVVGAGDNGYGQLNVSSWTGIVAVSAGGNWTVGLKSNGTVVAAGGSSSIRTGVSSWTGITAVAAGSNHVAGLKSNGTVVAIGDDYWGQTTGVSAWTGISQWNQHSPSGSLSGLKVSAGDSTADWGQISWNGATPAGTSIRFRTRGADTEAGLESVAWSNYIASSGSQVSTPSSRWLEVQAELATTDPSFTPVLDDLRVSFSVLPPCQPARPELGIAGFQPYWADYADYTARLLSVDYTLSNGGPDAYSVALAGATNTMGVTVASSLPVPFGDIAATASATATVRYNVPAGVSSFKASIFAEARDACGASYGYPGPIPGA